MVECGVVVVASYSAGIGVDAASLSSLPDWVKRASPGKDVTSI
jgi:hypothetical protein